MKTIILILLSTLSTFAQLDYSPQPTSKEAATRMHFAIRLFRGASKPQENFLRQAIRDRRSISETEASQLFTRDELRDVFFGIGREDLSIFRQIYDKSTIAEKKAVWSGLSTDEHIDARRINFAWGVGYLKLNDLQIDYLVRLSKALPNLSKEESTVWEDEAVRLFSKEAGTLLFGSIGPFIPCSKAPVVVSLNDSCPCNVGSSFNMSCDSECTPANGRCRITNDGCGFAWLYACSGFCVAS